MIGSFQATFREKSRHFSFIALCAGLMFSVVLMIPRASGTMRALIVNPSTYQQANNASWISVSIGFIMGFFLPLIGVIFLRNSIRLDRDQRTMLLFLTTKFSRLKYMFGKFISNLFLMGILWLTVLVFSLIGMLLKYGQTGFNLMQFLMPFMVLLPGLIFVSALTLLTEVLPGLRSKIGTPILAIFIVVLYAAGANYEIKFNHIQRIFNLAGSDYLISNIKQAVLATSGKPLTELKIIGSTTTHYTGTHELVFPVMQLTVQDLVSMGLLILISVLLVLISSFLLERRPLFNLSPSGWRSHLIKPLKSESLINLPFYLPLRLITASVSNYWLIVISLVWFWNWFASINVLTHVAFPILFLMMAPVFAELGVNVAQNNVYLWLKTFPYGQQRQVLQENMIGIILSIILIMPALFKISILSGLVLIAWAVQLPLAAQLLGQYTGSRRPIQLLMVVFFYLYLNGAPLLPFNNNHVILVGIYAVIAVISAVLLITPLLRHELIKR